MPDTPTVDVAGYLPRDLATRPDLWPAGPQRSGAHVTAYGLSAFSSHSAYATPTAVMVADSEQRQHLSVWPRDGIDLDAGGRLVRVASRGSLAGLLPGTPWQASFSGYSQHGGLLLHPDVLRRLAGERGDAFLQRLQSRSAGLRVHPTDGSVLRAAHELDATLLAPQSSPLLREAKSLELLAHLLEADGVEIRRTLTARERDRLEQARSLLLADLADAPTIAQLGRASGLNAFRLKQGFRELFGASVHVLYQRERMNAAWNLIASGQLTVAEAGHRLGYTNMSHFGAAFRKMFGLLPSELKRRTISSPCPPGCRRRRVE